MTRPTALRTHQTSARPVAATTSAAVDLRGLHKTYRSAGDTVVAVEAVDLTVEPGEVVALLGPNGAGKSTTIDLLLGLTRPDDGTVSIFGSDPAGAVREGAVGAMLQTGGLLPECSVRELVAVVASMHRAPLPVDEVLSRAQITDVAGRRTTKLSGGQSQRVRFALALVSNPDLLVLDEPTVAMDVEARHAFWAAMHAFAVQGRTVLFATHYLEEADAFADRVVLMRSGRIVADGTAASIKAMAGGRTVSATVPDPEPARLASLPGVTAVDVRGQSVTLRCSDSDAALRGLLADPAVRDVEVGGAGLEDAFLALTTGA